MNRIIILFICAFIPYVQNVRSGIDTELSSVTKPTEDSIGCVCGIFLSGSFKKSSKNPPKGNVTLIHETSVEFPCTPAGNKLCIRKCLDVVLKNAHNSSEVICDALGRDSYREKAYLFIKNCKDKWINTNLSGPRHYCCKEGSPYKCSSH